MTPFTEFLKIYNNDWITVQKIHTYQTLKFYQETELVLHMTMIYM